MTEDPLAALDFAPTCEYEECSGVAFRMHRPPCRCFAALLCFGHALKARLELEVTSPVFITCPACGHIFPPVLLEHPIPRPNP